MSKYRYAVVLMWAVTCLMPLKTVASAQTAVPPMRGEKVHSMGQIQRWKPYVGPALAWDRRDPSSGGWEVYGGVSRSLLGPAIGVLDVAGEGYLRSLSGHNDGGFRLFGVLPFFGLQLGADYSVIEKNTDFVMSFSFPWRRGGPVGRGSTFRLDWFYSRNNSFSFGLSIPIFQPWMGKTRPQRDTVELPPKPKLEKSVYEPSAEMRTALAAVEEASVAINTFTVPFVDYEVDVDEAQLEMFTEALVSAKAYIRRTDRSYPRGRSWDALVTVYHRELERAFTIAADSGEEVGAKVAKQARHTLLREVVLRYNRLLGQRKRTDSLLGFGMRAEEVFGAWLFTSSGIAPTKHAGIMYVFRELIHYWESNRHNEKRNWGDSRLVWIPLHYVIRQDECDSQKELNAILELALQQNFTDANDVHYIVNELFQPELHRMIHAAEDYHVLWIHDYRGKNSAGKPDRIGYLQTVESYMKAMIDRVREYETKRKIPVYIIILDQIYYEENDGRRWLTLLENPLDHNIRLQSGYEEWEDHIKAVQQELREAVEASPTLQAGRKRYGENWLKNLIKVHVNNTNPADMSFRSNYLFGWVPFVPDVLLRDHRKISFYDVTELDPSKGEAIYTGMGVGEHYTGPTWDDRAILVAGPALVGLKNSAREVLLSQGFKPRDIPLPLRSLPFPENYEQLLDELKENGWNDTAMQVHNAVGYGMKDSNMLKATLYNLMPQGTRMFIPDSLWNSAFWAGMMLGAALRGCWVFPIAPTLANAPSDGIPQMTRSNEVFTRLVVAQNILREEIEAAGGMFRVGIFNAQHDVGDFAANFKAFNRTAAKNEVYRKIFPFKQSVYDFFEHMAESIDTTGIEVQYLTEDVDDRRPKLHLKTQFFGSGDALESLITMDEWQPVVEAYFKARATQLRFRNNYVDVKKLRAILSESAQPLADRWYRTTTPEQREKTFFFLTVGSHNMDYRGKFMDGEVSVIVAGKAALISYLDFAGILARTEWVESMEELNQLLPAQSGRTRWFSRFIKNAL